MGRDTVDRVSARVEAHELRLVRRFPPGCILKHRRESELFDGVRRADVNVPGQADCSNGEGTKGYRAILASGSSSESMVFTAGQIGLQPDTGELVAGGIEAETRQCLTNLSHVLEACGSELGLVLKTTVFLSDMNDFGKMNAVYGEFFSEKSAGAQHGRCCGTADDKRE